MARTKTFMLRERAKRKRALVQSAMNEVEKAERADRPDAAVKTLRVDGAKRLTKKPRITHSPSTTPLATIR